jgi:hypothetical protein
MHSRQFIRILALAALLVPSRLVAGVADSPLPELVVGQTTYHVYTVPSCMSGFGLETFFGCTSLEDTATIQIGVEIFGSGGGAPFNDAAATSLSVGPGGTRIFGTSAAVGILVASSIGPCGSQGSARILATSKKLACTAFLADHFYAPPTSMVYLTIISRLKQKAFN